MHWSSSTISILQKLHNKDEFAAWTQAVQDGQIDQFSEELEQLLHRLAGVAVAELELDADQKEKFIKILELAAVGGKTL